MELCVSCSVMSNSVTPGTVARQAPLSVGFTRQEYWRGLPFPPPGDPPDPGTELMSLVSPAWQAISLPPRYLVVSKLYLKKGPFYLFPISFCRLALILSWLHVCGAQSSRVPGSSP